MQIVCMVCLVLRGLYYFPTFMLYFAIQLPAASMFIKACLILNSV